MLATHSIIIIVASAFYLSSKWEIMGLGSSGKSFRYSAEWRSGSWSPNSACHKIRKYTVGLTSTLKGKVQRYFQPPVFSPFKLTKATDQRVNRRIIRLFLFEKNDYTGYQILMRYDHYEPCFEGFFTVLLGVWNPGESDFRTFKIYNIKYIKI